IGALLVASAGLLLSGNGIAAEAAREPGSAAALASGAPAANGEAAKIEGFRSAGFGMTEAQVRQAIRKDFPAAGEKIASELNPAEKTTVLTIRVPDLIPGTGSAHVSYILGFTSKKLIQVNIRWAAEPKSPASAESVVGAANLLRNYFMAAGYAPDSIVANRQMPDGYIVFRGQDAQARMVVLLLSGATAPSASAHDPKAAPIGLLLSYILDPVHPDVYQVPKGQF